MSCENETYGHENGLDKALFIERLVIYFISLNLPTEYGPQMNYIFLQDIHSYFRYIILLFILLAFLDAVIGLISGKAYSKSSKLFAVGGLVFSHVQLVAGLSLYLLKDWLELLMSGGAMENAQTRFFTVEHISMMIIAIALVTIGYSRAKRVEESKRKFRSIAIFYGVAIVIIFAMIPWPFLKDFGTWY